MKRYFTSILLSAMSAIIVFAQDSDKLYLGGDISNLLNYEDYKVEFLDKNGRHINSVLQFLKSDYIKWNAARVRLFVNPEQKDWEGKTDVQVCQDIEYVVRLSKQIKRCGLSLLLDFHYSDTWADPNSQWIPKAWDGLTEEELADKLYSYTKESLERLVAEGATPDFIQIGNEIAFGMLFSVTPNFEDTTNRCKINSHLSYWMRFINLLNHASLACREVCPNAKIVIHIERLAHTDELYNYLIRVNSVDYDIIGFSYYPFWHGSLENLGEVLDNLAIDYPEKPIHMVEVAYNYQYSPGFTFFDFTDKWPYTIDGQAKFTTDFINEMKKHPNVKAFYWWCPEENGNGPDCKVLSYWMNRGLWHNTTHKALPALYLTQQFLEREVVCTPDITADEECGDKRYYDLSARELSSPSKGAITIEVNGKNVTKSKY